MSHPYLPGTGYLDATQAIKRQQDSNNLGTLSADVLNTLLNLQAFDSTLLEHHLSPRIVAIHVDPDPRWTCRSRIELCRKVRLQHSLNPNYLVDVRKEGIGVEVEEDGRKATVWVPAAVRDYIAEDHGRVVREWMLRMQWRRRRDVEDGGGGGKDQGSQWVCERLVGFSAAGGFIGEF
ncbi:hypothetical protein LTR17_006583 [Elasticomyces elasticus]|nr:hypothetical protein LTR17_006583 [Elasticomyces elasticus]